jgi:N-acetylglucosamine-6-phosphate deacetylase
MRVFVGARLFDGHRLQRDAALVVESGVVIAVTSYAERPRAADQRDLGGGILAPGFVDWQVNGGGGVLFNETPTPEGIQAIVEAHRRFGTTAMLPTLITDSPTKLGVALKAASEARGRTSGALGIHIEGPFIDPRRKGAHPPEWIRAMRDADADALIEGRTGVMAVTLAPAAASTDQISKLVQNGIVVSVGHSDATAEEARAAFDSGASAVTHLYNAMSQLGHRTPGLVGAALVDPRVICGFIADGFHVHEIAGRIAYNAKGPTGIALISDAMPPAASGPSVYELQGRRVNQVGLKLTLDDGTLAGAAITMLDAVRYSVSTLGIDVAAALEMATLTPARLLRIDDSHGRLQAGARADLVHLSDDLDLEGVWIAGNEASVFGRSDFLA